jgi:hypothetical protein
MIKQHNKFLKQEIQDSGCYLLTLLMIAKIERKKKLSPTDVNIIYKTLVDEGAIEEDCTILKPDDVIAAGIEYMGGDERIYQIGVKEDGKETFWGWVKPEDRKPEYYVADHDTSGYYGSHFILVDKCGETLYDPLFGEGWSSTGIDKIVYYRRF